MPREAAAIAVLLAAMTAAPLPARGQTPAAKSSVAEGEALLREKRFADAAAKFKAATVADPTFALAWYDLAYAQRRAGRCDEAVVAYRRFAAVRPGEPDPFYGLGLCLKELGDRTGAIAALKKYLSLENRPTEQKFVDKARAEVAALEGADSPPAAPASVAVAPPTRAPAPTKSPEQAAMPAQAQAPARPPPQPQGPAPLTGPPPPAAPTPAAPPAPAARTPAPPPAAPVVFKSAPAVGGAVGSVASSSLPVDLAPKPDAGPKSESVSKSRPEPPSGPAAKTKPEPKPEPVAKTKPETPAKPERTAKAKPEAPPDAEPAVKVPVVSKPPGTARPETPVEPAKPSVVFKRAPRPGEEVAPAPTGKAAGATAGADTGKAAGASKAAGAGKSVRAARDAELLKLADAAKDAPAKAARADKPPPAPAAEDPYMQSGATALAVRRLDDAARDFEQASRRQPGNAEARYQQGVALALGGRYSEASAAWTDALRRDPGHQAAAHNLARLREKVAADEKKGGLGTAAQRAREHLRAGRFALAEAEAEKILASRADAPETLLIRGRARLERGDAAGARADFQHALSLQPGSSEALRGLADTYLAEKDRDKAAYYLELYTAAATDAADQRRAERQLRELRRTKQP